jgi:hypothetical protein
MTLFKLMQDRTKRFFAAAVAGGTALLPVGVFAAPGGATPDLSWATKLVTGIGQIVESLIPVVFALILLAFFWGLANFVFREAKEGKESGQKLMIWSVIALFVAASIWGIVSLMKSLFGIDDKSTVSVPTVPLR